MSLPIDYDSGSDENPFVFDRMLSQEEPYEHMNPSKKKGADKKINEFEKYLEEELKEYLESYNDNEIEDNFTADEVNLQNSEKTNIVNFYYFIGRLNPPHDGHIYALKELVNKAKQDGSKALILLGSGPKQPDGDKRTMDNPILFDTKKAFIVSKLNEIGAIENSDYLIQEMTTPFADVSRYIGSYFINNDNVDNNAEIKISHIAGGKDDDASKLSSVLVHASNVASQNAPNAKVSTNVETIEAQPSTTGNDAMSATQVRKSVYRNYLDGTGYDGWEPRYKGFYGEMAPQIYEEILYPVRKLEDLKKDEQIIQTDIRNYVENGILPSYKEQKNKKPKTKTKKTGGTIRKYKKTKNKRNAKKYTRRNKK
uniref:Uncharacterized protein n=1 Tax=viral metagenome TaxID=1070528 RepID=A0A6C0DLH7_9ZZZZ